MSPVPGSVFRRILFWAHLASGVAAGLLILLMSVTGILLAYERQIIESAAQGNRIEAVSTPRLDADKLAGLARTSLPGDARMTMVFEADPSQPVVGQAGRDASVLLNPYTGSVIDAAQSARGFFRVVENWHRWMGGESRSGRATLMDLANLLFLFIVASGIYLWLPAVWRWRTFRGLMLFQTRYVNGKVRDFNWHHVFSFWMLIPLFLIALSGRGHFLWLGQNPVYKAYGEEAPRRGGPPAGGCRRRRRIANRPGAHAGDCFEPGAGMETHFDPGGAGTKRGYHDRVAIQGTATAATDVDPGRSRWPRAETHAATGRQCRVTRPARTNLAAIRSHR